MGGWWKSARILPRNGSFNVYHSRCARKVRNCHCNVKGLQTFSDGRQRFVGSNLANCQRCRHRKDNYKNGIESARTSNAISSICINAENTQFVTSSHDGSCVVWDLQKCSRVNALFASTQFLSIVYHPDESQLITTGTDRQITYWDATDLSQIRIVNGSDKGAVNKLDINEAGTRFVSV